MAVLGVLPDIQHLKLANSKTQLSPASKPTLTATHYLSITWPAVGVPATKDVHPEQFGGTPSPTL
jgi:hypothetical protein